MGSFGKRLLDIRVERGLSEADAAELTGISIQQYKDYEQEIVHSNRVESIGLLSAFGINLEAACEIIDTPNLTTLGAYMEEMNREEIPFAVLENDYIIIGSRDNSDFNYEVEAIRIKTAEDILRWIEHLSGKTWVTKYHIRDFVFVCSSYLQISLHPCR